MSLLSLEQVSVRGAGRGGCAHAILRDVTLDVRRAELVVVAGPPRSGCTTLLRIAAGCTRPTSGTARFVGVDLARRPMLGAPNGIAYAMTHFEPIVGEAVLEHVAAPLLARGFSLLRARTAAYRLLSRADAVGCALRSTAELSEAETIRVAIARALVTAPALLLLDESTVGGLPAPSGPRAGLCELLRSIARHDGIAVVLATHDRAALPDADHTLALERGSLVGMRRRGDVIPLRSSMGLKSRPRRRP